MHFSSQHCLNHYRSRLLSAGALSGVALCSALAPAASAQQVDSGNWTGDVVVVTGAKQSFAAPAAATTTRTATPIEKIPQSVQVLTRTLVEEQDLQTVSDALTNVSGVVPSSMMQTVLVAPYIRGFSAGYYFDGLPTYQLPEGGSDPATLINVERIEVAKGPTATLYGGGSGAPLAGLINIVSRSPSDKFEAAFGLRAGSFGTLGGDARVTLPFADGAAAVSLSGMYETADSLIDVVDSRRYALFPSLAWSLSDDTRLSVRGQISHLEQREYSGLPVELIGQVDPFTFAGAEDAPRTEVDNKLFSATLAHTFAADLEVSASVSRYEGAFREYSTYPLAPFVDTTYFFGSGQVPSNVTQTFATASLVKRFDYGEFRHQVLAGVDYDVTDYFGAMGLNFAWGAIDYANPSTNAPFGATPALSDLQNDDLKSTAVFLQDQIGIGDRLDLTVGLRWTKMDVKSSYTSFGTPFVDTDETYSRITPRIGATFEVVEGVSVFAGYAEGFKGVVAAFGVPTPKPQTSQSYEAGLKFAAPIEGLTGTVAVYQITRQNVTTSDPSNPFQSIQAGEQRSRGLETDLVYEPGPDLSVLFNYAFTDAEVTEDNTLPVGDRLRGVPEHRGRLAARYRFQGGPLSPLEIGAGVTITSSRELTLPNTTSIDGAALFDAQASWDFGPASLSLSIVNLTDEAAFEPYQYFAGQFVIPTQPRSAFVTLRSGF